MGKLLDKYTAEYNEAIRPGLAKGDKYIINPEIWISSKWEEDMGLEGPWQPEYKDALLKVAAEDEELGHLLCDGIEMRIDTIRKMLDENTATEPKISPIWDEDTQRYI